MRPRVTSIPDLRFSARVGGLVNEEIARGADPKALSMTLIELGLQTAKQDSAASYATLNALADGLRELASRMRS